MNHSEFNNHPFPNGVDAAFHIDGKIYFFKGKEYVRYDVKKGKFRRKGSSRNWGL